MPIPPRIAALPAYLSQDFTSAPPGHKFLLYFKGWQDDSYAPYKDARSNAHDPRERQREAAEISRRRAEMSREICAFGAAGQELLGHVRERQRVLAERAGDDVFTLATVSNAPFATGLGNEHPTENGFAFLTPYGLPYLAGSGVKGVLRKAAEELALFPKEYADSHSPEGEGEGLTMLDVWWLFGFEGAAGAWWPLTGKEERELSDEKKERRALFRPSFENHAEILAHRTDLPDFVRCAIPSGERDRFVGDPGLLLRKLGELRQEIHTRGALSFWDVFPAPEDHTLVVEIMTPHFGKYYRGEETPHDAGQPVPVTFVAVPAGSAFDFHVVCEPSRLPERLHDRWQSMLRRIFTHAFDWLGFGAKTAVGYGAMEHQTEEAVRQGKPQGTAPKPLVEVWEGARITWTKGNKMLSASVAGRKAQRVGQDGKTLLDSLPEDIRQRLDKGKEVIAPVEVEPLGNAWRLVAIVVGPAAGPK